PGLCPHASYIPPLPYTPSPRGDPVAHGGAYPGLSRKTAQGSESLGSSSRDMASGSRLLRQSRPGPPALAATALSRHAQVDLAVALLVLADDLPEADRPPLGPAPVHPDAAAHRAPAP